MLWNKVLQISYTLYLVLKILHDQHFTKKNVFSILVLIKAKQNNSPPPPILNYCDLQYIQLLSAIFTLHIQPIS
jgi:hypothetical protein